LYVPRTEERDKYSLPFKPTPRAASPAEARGELAKPAAPDLAQHRAVFDILSTRGIVTSCQEHPPLYVCPPAVDDLRGSGAIVYYSGVQGLSPCKRKHKLIDIFEF